MSTPTFTASEVKAMIDDGLIPRSAESLAQERLASDLKRATDHIQRLHEIDLRGKNLDIRYEYVGKREGGWSCWDANSYDGTSDGDSNHIGYGPEKEDALVDLMDKIGLAAV